MTSQKCLQDNAKATSEVIFKMSKRGLFFDPFRSILQSLSMKFRFDFT